MAATSDCAFMRANYTPSPIGAFAHNPLIEALPRILSDKEWVKTVEVFPRVTEAERALPPEQRKLVLVDLERFTYPLPEYLDFARRVESALYRGYSAKNPCLPTYNHYLHYIDSDETPVQPSTGRFESRSTGIIVVGPSGGGKSQMTDSVFGYFPQVIEHRTYERRDLPLTQVVWLKVDCPEDGSLITFAANFLSALDNVLGTHFFNDAFKSRFNKGLLNRTVIHLARTFNVGIILLEEFSNLTLPRSATPANVPVLLKLILNLMNGSGVPHVFSGNPEMFDVLQLSLKTSRRAENGGVIEMWPLHEAVWRAVSKRLWELQVTNPTTPWSEEGCWVLYEASRGIIDIAVRGFFAAQRLVIGSNDERLTETILVAGAREAIRLSDKVLDWSAQQNRSDDKWVPTPLPPAFDTDGVSDAESKAATRTKATKTPGNKGLCDPRRIQHPEFETAIQTLRGTPQLIPNRVKPDLMRTAYAAGDLIPTLTESDVLLVDPLALGMSN